MFIRYNPGSKFYEYDTSPGQTGAGPWLILPLDYNQLVNKPAGGITPHHATHETGGSDAIAALAASVINSGILADARLSSNVAFVNAYNIFSTSQRIQANNPLFEFYDPSGPANKKYYNIQEYLGDVYFQFKNDDNSNVFNSVEILRTGGIAERGRTVAMGDWQQYGPSWTCYGGTNPTPGNGNLFGRYTLIGHTCIYNIFLQFGSTTGGGTGYWAFSLPIATNSSLLTGSIFVYNGASGQSFIGQLVPGAYMFGIGSTIGAVMYSSTYTYQAFLSGTYPFTWTNGSTAFINGFYEIN